MSESEKNTKLPAVMCAVGSENMALSDEELRTHVDAFLKAVGEREDVLLLPPDFTRFNSRAGDITRMICEHYGFIKRRNLRDEPPPEKVAKIDQETNIQILPTLGTHAPMTESEIRKMYGDALAETDPSPFIVHKWRSDIVTIGEAPASMVKEATRGMVEKPWPAQLNELIWNKRKSLLDESKQKHPTLVLSIGQVVPHEVMGMANYNKNLFVGAGGLDAINLSHFIGAVHGMERMMGRKENPLRSILNYASEKFLENELDLWYILTVVATDPDTGKVVVRGLYIGRDIQCYSMACDLSLKVNFTLLDKPVKRMVTYLDPEEFHSTWLGNKAIYRTRMAMADNGELIILAPGIKKFGEDDAVDKLIRKYGYKGTPTVMKMMEENKELQENLSAVAHLIHGSTEGRFEVIYCPGHLSQEEVEAAGFKFGILEDMTKRFDITTLKDGWNEDDDGEFFFIKNPALGLWAFKERFENSD